MNDGQRSKRMGNGAPSVPSALGQRGEADGSFFVLQTICMIPEPKRTRVSPPDRDLGTRHPSAHRPLAQVLSFSSIQCSLPSRVARQTRDLGLATREQMGGWRPLLHHHASIKTELDNLPVDAGLRSWPPGRPAPRAAGRRGHAKPRSRMVSDPGASVPLTPMIRVKSTRSLATFIHRFRHGRWHGSTDITNNHKPASSSMSRSLLSLRASHALPPPNPATPWSSAHQAAGRPTRTAPCFCSRLSRGEVSTDGKG